VDVAVMVMVPEVAGTVVAGVNVMVACEVAEPKPLGEHVADVDPTPLKTAKELPPVPSSESTPVAVAKRST